MKLLKIPLNIQIKISSIMQFVARRDMLEYFVFVLFVSGYLQMFGGSAEYASRQLSFFIVGYISFYFMRLDQTRKKLKYIAIPFYLASLVLLTVVLFTSPIKGASRWFNILGFSLQPSEFAKISTLLCISFYFVYLKKFIRSRVLYISLPILIAVAPAALIFVQPDFGSAFLLASTSMALVYFNIKLSQKEAVVLILIFVTSSILIFLNLREFQRQRISDYFQSYSGVERSENFNSVQARIAIGSGGILGKGLGGGTQSKLAFLPEDHTDFAFSSYAEQFGFVGSAILVSFVLLLLREMILSISHSKYPILRTMLPGVILLFGIQTVINISMNVGLLPIVGVPLPLVSYGGSSLLIWMILLGLF